jgi:hypothetical protein
LFVWKFQIQLHEETGKVVSSSIESEVPLVALQITSYGKSWVVRRSYEHFRLLDEQLHRCIYDRKFSQLPENINHPAEVNSSADRHTHNAKQ